MSGSNVIGSAVTANVVNGTVSVPYLVPASTAVGPYIIEAQYNGTSDYTGFTDSSHILTINAPTTTAAATTTATYNTTSPIPLTATVTSLAGTVTMGIVTFTIISGSTVIGSPVIANVSGGTASTSTACPRRPRAGSTPSRPSTAGRGPSIPRPTPPTR